MQVDEAILWGVVTLVVYNYSLKAIGGILSQSSFDESIMLMRKSRNSMSRRLKDLNTTEKEIDELVKIAMGEKFNIPTFNAWKPLIFLVLSTMGTIAISTDYFGETGFFISFAFMLVVFWYFFKRLKNRKLYVQQKIQARVDVQNEILRQMDKKARKERIESEAILERELELEQLRQKAEKNRNKIY